MNGPLDAVPGGSPAESGHLRPLTILVAADCIRAGRIGGVEQMVYNLVRGLAAGGHGVAMLAHRPERIETGMREFVRRPRCGMVRDRVAGRSRFLDEQMACLDRAASADAILFPNYHTPLHVPRRAGRRVTVIHDLQFRAYPRYFTARKRLWLRWAHGWTLRRADAVVAISEHVRRSMAQVYGSRLMRKVKVIHNPVSWDRFERGVPASEASPAGGRPYLLSVAAQYPHKNLETLVRAYKRSRSADSADLVLVGQWSRLLGGPAARLVDIPRLVADLGLQGRVHVTGYIGDEELGRLYRRAALFALPSLYEGFGMPAIEAMGLGLPTLVTRRASLEEVTLGQAHYVENPTDPDDWAARIDEVMADPSRWRPSPQAVRSVRERYAPATIADRYAELLAGVDSNRR